MLITISGHSAHRPRLQSRWSPPARGIAGAEGIHHFPLFGCLRRHQADAQGWQRLRQHGVGLGGGPQLQASILRSAGRSKLAAVLHGGVDARDHFIATDLVDRAGDDRRTAGRRSSITEISVGARSSPACGIGVALIISWCGITAATLPSPTGHRRHHSRRWFLQAAPAAGRRRSVLFIDDHQPQLGDCTLSCIRAWVRSPAAQRRFTGLRRQLVLFFRLPVSQATCTERLHQAAILRKCWSARISGAISTA